MKKRNNERKLQNERIICFLEWIISLKLPGVKGSLGPISYKGATGSLGPMSIGGLEPSNNEEEIKLIGGEK